MKTQKIKYFILCLLVAFSGLMQAQEKSIREELQELRERTRLQNESLFKTVDSPQRQQNYQTIRSEENFDFSDFPKDKKWSLEECIQYAISKNINIQQLRLNMELAEIKINTAKSSRVPNLNLSLGQEWNFGRAQDLSSEFYDQNQSHTNVAAQSIIPVFTGFRIPNQIEQSKIDLKAATEDLEKAKEDLALNITYLFLQVLLNKEIYNISKEQLDLVEEQVERTVRLVEAGNVPRSQLYEIEAQFAKDTITVVEAQNFYDLALMKLAQSIELERFSNFDILIPEFEGEIISKFINSIQPAEIIYDNAVNFKPVILGQEYRVQSSEKGVKIAQSAYFPQIDFFLGAGSNYYHIYEPTKMTNPFTQQAVELNPPFAEQFCNYGGRMFGFSVNIPIFNRNQTRNQVRSAKIDVQNQELILENLKKTLYKEIHTAYKYATSAQEKYSVSWRAVKSATESFEFAKRRYEVGNATVYEFNEARTRLIQSQSEQAQAKYEYILRTKILDFYNGIAIKL